MAAAFGGTPHGFPSVRAGIEMALIDALARRHGIPLFRFFGGFQNQLATDITI